MTSNTARTQVRAGMVGMGMIFDDTYRPFFENVRLQGLYDRSFGDIDVPLVATASKTGQRADRYQKQAKSLGIEFENFRGDKIRGMWFDDSISTSQLVSLVLGSISLVLLAVLAKRRDATTEPKLGA